MNIIFIHRSFPAQFRYIATALSIDSCNNVVFITEEERNEIQGINKILYKTKKRDLSASNPYSYMYQEAITQGEAVLEELVKLKQSGFKPDLIYGFSSWGGAMFVKDVFPDVPFLCYFEWYRNPEGADVGFDGNIPDEFQRAEIRCNNSHVLSQLESCDFGISPTRWQKAQFPTAYHDKIAVVHDGIDTGRCAPDKYAKFLIKENNLELSTNDEIITYGTRGMEPYRGFPEFMEAVEKLQKLRPNAHFVVAGQDIVCYGQPLNSGTYKELMLNKLDLDLNRLHFVGELSFVDFVRLLQVSSVHVYLTYPFVLSWSILNAMATGCTIVASDVEPVREVIQDGVNGLLVDHFDIDKLVEKIEYALSKKEEMLNIRENARNAVLSKYALENCLMQQLQLMMNLINK